VASFIDIKAIYLQALNAYRTGTFACKPKVFRNRFRKAITNEVK